MRYSVAVMQLHAHQNGTLTVGQRVQPVERFWFKRSAMSAARVYDDVQTAYVVVTDRAGGLVFTTSIEERREWLAQFLPGSQ